MAATLATPVNSSSTSAVPFAGLFTEADELLDFALAGSVATIAPRKARLASIERVARYGNIR